MTSAEFCVLRLKQLHGPAKPVGDHDRASFDSDIMTGKVSTSTIWSFLGFGTYQRDLAHIAQVANRMSDAKHHSLGLASIRHDPDGLPLEPAVLSKESCHMRPLLRLGGALVEGVGFDASRFAQSDDKGPMLICNGILDLHVVIAALR